MDETSADIFDLDYVRREVRALWEKLGDLQQYASFISRKGPDELVANIKIDSRYAFATGANGTAVPLPMKKRYMVITGDRDEYRLYTTDLDELLYWIFKSVTSEMASYFEATDPSLEEESTISSIDKQQEFLKILSPKWAARYADRHRDMSQSHPVRYGDG